MASLVGIPTCNGPAEVGPLPAAGCTADLADPSSSLSSPRPPSPGPPSYQQARQNALASAPALPEGGMWVGVQCADGFHPSLVLSFDTQIHCGGDQPVETLPKVPEFYHVLSKFDQVHSTLQDHAKGICNATKVLFDLQKDLAAIQEFWMEIGMDDVAHDVVPLIDFARQLLPQSTFSPDVQPLSPSTQISVG